MFEFEIIVVHRDGTKELLHQFNRDEWEKFSKIDDELREENKRTKSYLDVLFVRHFNR